MLTHRALLANIEQASAVEPPMMRPDDVVLVPPLFHVYGLNAVLGQVLRQRARLVLVGSFDVEGSLDVVEDEAVTVVPVAPRAGALDGRGRPAPSGSAGSGWRCRGRRRCRPSLVDAFVQRTGMPVHQGYGLTEAAPVVTSTCAAARSSRDRSGRRCRASRSGSSTTTATPPRGGPREIQVRGANPFSGYWPDGADGPDADGWWPTGDVGFLDADGDLFLVDRLKELVIVSGFNVYPSEVEDVVAEVEGWPRSR